jgi:signal transduction histidine kinase
VKDLDQHILYTAWARAVDAAMLADHNRAEADRAEAVAQAKTRFLAAMAHELKNPVNAISGYAQFLQLMQEGQRASDAARCLDSRQRSMPAGHRSTLPISTCKTSSPISTS